MAKRDTGYSRQQEQDIKKIWGKNLRAARENAGMTQEEVAQIIWKTTNRNRISEIENGKTNLSAMDLLMFHNLYGQSIDYIFGLSIEPEIDALAGTVNHIVKQSRSMLDDMAVQMATVLTNGLRDVCKSDTAALLSSTSKLCAIIKSERSMNEMPVGLGCALNNVLYTIKQIEQKQMMQDRAVQTQISEHIERMTLDHGHHMIADINKVYQYSIPLPPPDSDYTEYASSATYRYRVTGHERANATSPVVAKEVDFG